MNQNNIRVYIDGANLDKETNKLGWRVDYHRFYIWLMDKYDITSAYIFIGYMPVYQNLYKKMKNAGFIIVFKDITNSRGQIKGNCDADIVLYAVRDFYESGIEGAILVSSDGDFANLIRYLKSKSKVPCILSPSNKCSIFLLRTGIPVIFLDQVKGHISLRT